MTTVDPARATTTIAPTTRPAAGGAPQKLRLRKGERPNWVTTTLLSIGTLTVLIPLYFAVAMSLKTDQQAAAGSGFDWPNPITFANFKTAWAMTSYPRPYISSLGNPVCTDSGESLL